MNQDIKKQWVAALRSGEYKQGTTSLNRNSKFCCLGVLCELAVKAGELTSNGDSGEEGRVLYGNREHSAVLPAEAQRWAGLTSSLGAETSHGTLTKLNDDLGYSFNQIADIIEAEL